MLVELYTKPNRVFCEKAKALLKAKGIDYDEYEIGKHVSVDYIKQQYPTMKTVPIILVDYEMIGGFSELNERLMDYETNIYLTQ